MKKTILFLVIVFCLASCSQKANSKDVKISPELVPTPKEIILGEKALMFSNKSKIYGADLELKPLLELFKLELNTLTGFDLEITSSKDADISFEIDTTLNWYQYQIAIENSIHISAGSLQAVRMSRNTLLQLANVEEEKLLFPQLQLNDTPDANYRGLMIDLARNWHSMETVKKLINLASYYKTNYVQLHFTDNQSYTLPSKKYPKLPTPNRHYSFEDLRELEAYSRARGVTIIPEIDVPGHAKSFVTAYPELFGIEAYEENPYILNMGKEEVYNALDEIFSEILPIFKATRYFHIGGDEARFAKVMEDVHVKKYMTEKDLGNEDVHELYRHFLVRLNDIVKKYDKQTCIWEGFEREGAIKIPKDIIVYEFESLYHLPDELIEDGYKVVNTSWKPLYVVNEKKWEPKTIYDWNMWRFQNWWSKSPATENPIQVEKTPLIIGAQMCTWEQPEEIEFSSLRKRLPVMNERLWNTNGNLSYEEFMSHLESTDAKLSILVDDSKQDDLLIGYNHIEK